MHSTNFSDFELDKINEALVFAIENKFSDFYRKKLNLAKAPKINSYEDFQKISFLIKDDILSSSIKEKTFIEEDEVIRYKISSGTSNKKLFTIIPDNSTMTSFAYPGSGETKKILILMPVMSSSFYTNVFNAPKGVIAVPGDVANLSFSAKVLMQTKLEGIISNPTIINEFIKELKKIDFDFNLIKYISLGSEFCSVQKLNYLKSTFPKATFNFRFASSEIGKRGSKCENLLKNFPPSVYHPFRKNLIEILKSDGSPAELGEEGEIVHTDLHKRAFPLLRYKTGDMAKLEKINCPCGENLIFSIQGKKGLDYFKFSGVILRSEAIEASLEKVSHFFENKYQMHIYEESSLGEPKPKLVIQLKPKEEKKEIKNDPPLLENIKEIISSNLHLSSKSTLKSLSDRGVFLPLEIEIVDNFPFSHSKSRNIISHLQ